MQNPYSLAILARALQPFPTEQLQKRSLVRPTLLGLISGTSAEQVIRFGILVATMTVGRVTSISIKEIPGPAFTNVSHS
jgi:hypothetical protein